MPKSSRANYSTTPGPMATTTDNRYQKKRRAAIACTACHARKVRCNVVLVGQPCSNCQQDQTLCALHVSARGKHKRRRVNRDIETARAQAVTSDPAPTTDPQTAPLVQVTPLTTSPHIGSQTATLAQAASPTSRVDVSAQDEYECQANLDTYWNIVNSTDASQAEVPMYVGELQSLRFIFHVAQEDKGISCKAHYLVPAPRKRRLSPEELACLEAKGSFSTETEDLRHELLTLFFDYVYPILPIVDPHDFFCRYNAGDAANVSPLLLQSMFLAASNFVSRETVKRSAWPSVMVMKRRFYERAKALYDFEYESDKLCLIQAVLLMGYWLGNSHDRMDSWHWIGVAISLSQSLGLHRDPGCSKIPHSQRALWRRIWWCCFSRDRCIALGMGRAFRINVADCDVKNLTLEDLVSNGACSPLTETSAAIIRRCNNYAPIFLEIVKLSRLLGDVLASVYRPRRKEDFPDPTSWSTAESIEERLTAWQVGLDPRCKVDAFSVDEPIAMISHKYYIQILHHVTLVTLYKPFVFQGDLLPTNPASDVRARIAWEGCQLSAFAATDSFRRLIELDLVKFLPPESVTVLIAIVAILFLSKCLSAGMKWHLASQNLDLAMLVVQQLQEKYLAARFIFTYYTAAFEKVAPSQRPSLEQTLETSVPLPTNCAYNNDSTPIDTASADTSDEPASGMMNNSYNELESGLEQPLDTWADCLPTGADFDMWFGAEGIFRGLDEFDFGDLGT